MKSKISTPLFAMLAAALLGLTAGGCTEVVGSDVDDVDVQLELDQSTDGVEVDADETVIHDVQRAPDDEATREDPYAPAAEKQSQGLDFQGILVADPEPCPWAPEHGTDK